MSFYLTTFACQCIRYRNKKLPFRTTLAGGMFQRKIDETITELPNLFGTADDILVVGYDYKGTDHHRSLCRVFQICEKETKVQQRQMQFQMHQCPFLSGNYSLIWGTT